MGRNKLIYTLADQSLVVEATEGQGGTWSGATENLERQWTPLFVYRDSPSPGNAKLLRRGALPVSEADLEEGGPLVEILAARASQHAPPPSEEDLLARVHEALAEPLSAADLAARLGLSPGRTRRLLEQALAEGLVRKQARPVRYVRVAAEGGEAEQLKMF